MSADDYLRRAY